MAKNEYRSVLRDLKERRAKLDAAIETIEGILGVPKEKAAPAPVAAGAPAAVLTPAPVSENGGKISMVDACYNVLKEHGDAMHAKDIATQINAKYGKNVSYNSIAASLPTSAGRRFVNLGHNIFALTEWVEK
jgi:hypothetical protein